MSMELQQSSAHLNGSHAPIISQFDIVFTGSISQLNSSHVFRRLLAGRRSLAQEKRDHPLIMVFAKL